MESFLTLPDRRDIPEIAELYEFINLWKLSTILTEDNSGDERPCKITKLLEGKPLELEPEPGPESGSELELEFEPDPEPKLELEFKPELESVKSAEITNDMVVLRGFKRLLDDLVPMEKIKAEKSLPSPVVSEMLWVPNTLDDTDLCRKLLICAELTNEGLDLTKIREALLMVEQQRKTRDGIWGAQSQCSQVLGKEKIIKILYVRSMIGDSDLCPETIDGFINIMCP